MCCFKELQENNVKKKKLQYRSISILAIIEMNERFRKELRHLKHEETQLHTHSIQGRTRQKKKGVFICIAASNNASQCAL